MNTVDEHNENPVSSSVTAKDSWHSTGETRISNPVKRLLTLRRYPSRLSFYIFWFVFAIALSLVLFFIPFPYVIFSPGPTYDVLASGSKDGGKLIEVKDAKTYPTDGHLLMTTVSSLGGPTSSVNLASLIYAWFDPNSQILDEKTVFPKELKAQTVERINTAQMDQSQMLAQAVALGNLGYTVSVTTTVVDDKENALPPGLAPGDVLEWIEVKGKRRVLLTDANALPKFMSLVPPQETVKLGVRRDSTHLQVEVKTKENPNNSGSLLGIYIANSVKVPLNIEFHLKDVGGPSAGLMFALGLVDELTSESLTGGHTIAGTGALSLNGKVEAISGIAQKMAGAKDDGATYFLAPRSNCKDVIGHVPSGLQVFSVDSFTEGLSTLKAIASGNTAGLKSCEAS